MAVVKGSDICTWEYNNYIRYLFMYYRIVACVCAHVCFYLFTSMVESLFLLPMNPSPLLSLVMSEVPIELWDSMLVLLNIPLLVLLLYQCTLRNFLVTNEPLALCSLR
uniref:Uncharacterized protein n=1 Tax=Cacopsylla melanoneura TaxID=428564 RepID=A0A8D8TXN9_9HEMI